VGERVRKEINTTSLDKLRSMENMDKELHSDTGLTKGTPVVQELEEEFTFVSRKKNGRRQNGASTIKASTPQTVASPSLRTAVEEPKEASLPGWGSNKKTGKIKKNSQRAKMMGSRGADQEERTLEWGQRLMDDRVMTLKQSKFYTAFQGTTTLSFFFATSIQGHTASTEWPILNPYHPFSLDLVQLTLCPPCKEQQQSADIKDTQRRSSLTSEDAALQLESKHSLDKEPVVMQPQEDNPSQSDRSTANTAADEDPSRSNFIDMICYGIGSIEASRNAQFQLAMALSLKDILQVIQLSLLRWPKRKEWDVLTYDVSSMLADKLVVGNCVDI
jgi:hypothetical protein